MLARAERGMAVAPPGSPDVVLYGGRNDKDEPVVERGTREEFAAAVCTQQ